MTDIPVFKRGDIVVPKPGVIENKTSQLDPLVGFLKINYEKAKGQKGVIVQTNIKNNDLGNISVLFTEIQGDVCLNFFPKELEKVAEDPQNSFQETLPKIKKAA